jgi:hypothetical protein
MVFFGIARRLLARRFLGRLDRDVEIGLASKALLEFPRAKSGRQDHRDRTRRQAVIGACQIFRLDAKY